MGRNNQDLGEPKFDMDRLNRAPTLSEYATAKKEFEQKDCGNPKCKECYKEVIVGIDLAEGDDETVCLVVDRETMACIYWNTIPPEQKRKIKIGDKHVPLSRTNNK